MRGIKNTFLLDLKSSIENLSKNNQIGILQILNEDSVTFTENANGIFFDIKELSKETVHKINTYIEYCEKSQRDLEQREHDEEQFRKELETN
jgi:hypothetical protein